jgi:hypothetical protein
VKGELHGALENIASMLETLAVFHAPMLALKAVALWNVLCMSVTDATFHLLMSALNVGLEEKSEAMLVTADVSQSAMLPYVIASPPLHAVTAAATLEFEMHTAHVTEPTVHA